MTELSVIIPSMRPRGMIEAIPALEADASAEYEVIVREDDGAATARNRGAREASTNKLVFIDDDARPRPGYLRQMSTRLDEYDAVAGRVVDPGSGVSARMAPNYGYYQGDEPHLTDTGVGCNLGVRKDVFEQTDGFDDRIEWGGEDTLFIRSLAKNHELLYDPDAVVEHPMFESVTEFWRKQLRHGRSDVYVARARRTCLPVLVRLRSREPGFNDSGDNHQDDWQKPQDWTAIAHAAH